MSGHPHTWHFPLVAPLFPLPQQHILVARNAARRVGGVRLPPRAAHFVGLQQAADHFIVFAQRPLPETLEQELLAQVRPAARRAGASFAQHVFAQVLQRLRVPFGLLRREPALVQNTPATLLLKMSPIVTHSIVHTYKAVLAARGKEQRARGIFNAGRSGHNGKGHTLHKRKMWLQAGLPEVYRSLNPLAVLALLRHHRLPAIAAQQSGKGGSPARRSQSRKKDTLNLP